MSCPSVPASGKTQRSRGTPAASAAPTEHNSSAVPWSRSQFEFMTLVYGKPTMRLSSVAERISSAVIGVGDQAWGLATATALNPAQSSAMRSRCRSRDSFLEARIADSKIG